MMSTIDSLEANSPFLVGGEAEEEMSPGGGADTRNASINSAPVLDVLRKSIIESGQQIAPPPDSASRLRSFRDSAGSVGGSVGSGHSIGSSSNRHPPGQGGSAGGVDIPSSRSGNKTPIFLTLSGNSIHREDSDHSLLSTGSAGGRDVGDMASIRSASVHSVPSFQSQSNAQQAILESYSIGIDSGQDDWDQYTDSTSHHIRRSHGSRHSPEGKKSRGEGAITSTLSSSAAAIHSNTTAAAAAALSGPVMYKPPRKPIPLLLHENRTMGMVLQLAPEVSQHSTPSPLKTGGDATAVPAAAAAAAVAGGAGGGGGGISLSLTGKSASASIATMGVGIPGVGIGTPAAIRASAALRGKPSQTSSPWVGKNHYKSATSKLPLNRSFKATLPNSAALDFHHG